MGLFVDNKKKSRNDDQRIEKGLNDTMDTSISENSFVRITVEEKNLPIDDERISTQYLNARDPSNIPMQNQNRSIVRKTKLKTSENQRGRTPCRRKDADTKRKTRSLSFGSGKSLGHKGDDKGSRWYSRRRSLSFNSRKSKLRSRQQDLNDDPSVCSASSSRSQLFLQKLGFRKRDEGDDETSSKVSRKKFFGFWKKRRNVNSDECSDDGTGANKVVITAVTKTSPSITYSPNLRRKTRKRDKSEKNRKQFSILETMFTACMDFPCNKYDDDPLVGKEINIR